MSLLSLPQNIRDDIFKRVLVIAHPLYLFQDRGFGAVETFGPEIQRQLQALLYTNHQVRGEASAVLYGSNCFSLVDTTEKKATLLESFLSCIGPTNAGLLSHLCINFPAVESVNWIRKKVTLREDGLRSLKLVQDKCTSLKTLEASVHSQNSEDLTQANPGDSKFIQEALSQIDAQLKLIPSLSRIIVRFYNGDPASEARELMQGYGWVVLIDDRGP